MVDNKPPDDKTTELFQQLHTPELIKELLGIEPFRTVRPTDPSILQLEMLEFDMYELYHFPNFLEFDDPDLLLHHLQWAEKLNEHEAEQFLTITCNFKVCNFDLKNRTYHPLIRSTKDID